MVERVAMGAMVAVGRVAVAVAGSESSGSLSEAGGVMANDEVSVCFAF
jgi:hypothetical protein